MLTLVAMLRINSFAQSKFPVNKLVIVLFAFSGRFKQINEIMAGKKNSFAVELLNLKKQQQHCPKSNTWLLLYNLEVCLWHHVYKAI